MSHTFSGHGQARRAHRGKVLLATVWVPLLLVCVSAFLTTRTSASLIAASKIQYCQKDGAAAASEPAGCTRKMIVTLTIDSGQLAGVEDVVFINSAADETDSTGAAATLQFEALQLSTSRTPVVYRYPVFYTHNYNAKPFEENIGGTLLKQCNADFNSKTATCGISTDTSNQPVPYSQGFCCDCGVCATLGLCQADWRASNACNLFQTYTTASCLRFAELWYSGYTIGTMRTSYDITLRFSTNISSLTDQSGNTSTVAAELHLSPQTPEDSATSPSVMARLIGDFSSSEQPWDLTSRMLFIPSMPRTHVRVAAGVEEYMLLATSLVSPDGRTCNKVGVSYEAFASQGNACNLAKGSCLAAQLEDYRSADVKAVAAGQAAQYLVSAYGSFFIEKIVDGATTSPYLSYQATSAGTSMVTVTVNADDLQFIVSVSPGRLLSVKMNLDTIRASTNDGVLEVSVQNTGTLSSRYTVAVPACTDGIFPITAQTIYLAAQEARALNFSVLVQDIDMNTDHAQCNVTLRNQDGLLDSSAVTFTVNSTTLDNGPQGGTGPTDGGTWQDGTANSTCGTCSFIDFKCSFGNACVGLIVGQLALILGIIVALVILFKLRHCLCGCFSCLCGSSGSKDSRAANTRKRRRASSSIASTEDGGGDRTRRARTRRDTTKSAKRVDKKTATRRTRSAPAGSRSRALVRAAPKTQSFANYSSEPFATDYATMPMYSAASAVPRVAAYHEPFEDAHYMYGDTYAVHSYAPATAAPSQGFYAPLDADARYQDEAEMQGLYTYTPHAHAHAHDDTDVHVYYAGYEAEPYGSVETGGYAWSTARAPGGGRRRGSSGGAGLHQHGLSEDQPPLLRPLSLDDVSEAQTSSRLNW